MGLRRALIVALIATALAIAGCLFYSSESTNAVLFHYGPAPEVPQGRVIAVFNPFRNRDSENTAARLVHDLRIEDCPRVMQAVNIGDYDPRVCFVMHGTTRDSLVWREDADHGRVLVYSIPQKQANLRIVFRQGEAG